MSEETLGSVVEKLRSRGLTLAASESCTGGLFSHTVTNVPGASGVFKGSVVAYTDGVKKGVLSVSESTLARSGAVSGAAALEMAQGAAKLLKADIGIGITGNAGPDAERGEVGEVYICIVKGPEHKTGEFRFPGSRVDVKFQAVEAALKMLFDILEEGK